MPTETYIPYSKRNNIADPELGGLLDYCERIMGWEIGISGGIYNTRVYNRENLEISLRLYDDGDVRIYWSSKGASFFTLPGKVFFRTYKTLLPCIRDLYSK